MEELISVNEAVHCFFSMQVLSVLDLSCHESQVKLEKVLHRLKWNDFPGLQALLLKVIKFVNNHLFFLSNYKLVSLQQATRLLRPDTSLLPVHW